MPEKPFEFKVGGREISAKLGQLVCVLFRTQQEVDYFAVSLPGNDETNILRVFNNAEVARWMAGLVIHPDGRGITTDEGQTFHDEYGWHPPVVIKPEPSDQEVEMFMDLNAGSIDSEWEGLG